jgi:hypothetical protein
MFASNTVGAYLYPDSNGTTMLRDLIRTRFITGDAFMEEKLISYQLYWQFYKNKHWLRNNDKLLSFNYCRAIIDKVNSFIAGKDGFRIGIVDDYGGNVDETFETNYEALIEFNWRKNKKGLLFHSMLQMGGICGDSYCFLEPKIAEKYISIELLDSRNVLPVFDKGNYKKLDYYKVVQPLYFNKDEYVQKVTEYHIDKQITYFKKDTSPESAKYELVETPNNLGFIPIIHIENQTASDMYGGMSDLVDIVKINKIYNEMAEDVKMIIDYYAQPTTVITGGQVGQLKRGINQIWSGLPADASVFNLKLDTDLSASLNFLATLKNSMHDMTGVPDAVLGKMEHVSNTSAAALQILYHPIIEAADRKVLTYGDGIERLNTMLMKMFIKFFPSHTLIAPLAAAIVKDTDEFFSRYIATPIFTYGLPTDRLLELNQISIELDKGIASKKEVMNRLGKKNIPKIMAEAQTDEELEIKNRTDEAKEVAAAQNLPPKPLIEKP